MTWALLLSLAMGVGAVVQGGMNKKIGESWGLPGTMFVNNIVFFLISLATFFAARTWPQAMPQFFKDKGSFAQTPGWYLAPGVIGFLVVLSMPLAIARMGALRVFVGLVAAQMVTSILWDLWVEKTPLNAYRVVGATLSAIGAIVASLDQPDPR